MRRILVQTLFGLALLMAGPSAFSQPLSFGTVDGPQIAVLNQERLFSETRFGQRIQAELEAASAELSRQNRELEAALLQEERDLTEQRGTMSAEEFQPLAEEFDARVEDIRQTQADRLRRLNAQADGVEQLFIEMTTPIMRDLLAERGVTAVLDSRAVIYVIEGADITDAAIARIDRDLGDGGDAPILEQIGGPGTP